MEQNGAVTSGVTYLENVPYGTAVIKKVDAADDKLLSGAEITIWDANDTEVFRGVTDERDRVYFVSPCPGTYTYRETIAPTRQIDSGW